MAVLPLDAASEAGREVLGGKAWSVAQMLRLGMPVPPAFVITTDECARFHDAGGQVHGDVVAALPEAMASLERQTGRSFGTGDAPLLVSVRSGAPVSMPGMMDTVLNLGMTADVASALAAQIGDAAFAADVRRRFEEQYAEIVGVPAPAYPWEQLEGAISAIFTSWYSDRAIAYRKDRDIDEGSVGTAVTVQAMVFGNLDEDSGTGVLFSRNPLTGSSEPYGEWLPRAQGEDVVSGRHDPLQLMALRERHPGLHGRLLDLAGLLEREGRDVQDIEFTVEGGRLWLLQARAAKRSAVAAVRLAVALEREGLIDRATALDRVAPEHVAAMLREHVEPAARAGAQVLATGRPACPGVVTGVVVTDPDEAEDRALDGEDVVLARQTTSPDDVRAMAAVAAVLTEIGGSTSHAAVVSRELGTACVVGCGAGKVTGLEGRVVTVDADVGEVLDGALPLQRVEEAADPDLLALTTWAREELGVTDDAALEQLLVRRRVQRPTGRAVHRRSSHPMHA